MPESRYDIGDGVYVQAGGFCGPTWAGVNSVGPDTGADACRRFRAFRETWHGWSYADGFKTFEQADACARAFAEKERDG